jgi:hypothetical protein
VFEVGAPAPAFERAAAEDPAAAAEDPETFAFDDEPPGPPTELETLAGTEVTAVPTATRFALRVLLGVSLAYAVLSVYLYTHPARLQATLGWVPVLGPMLLEQRLDATRVRLADVRGEYRRVKGDQLVFVISGAAVNTAPVPVRGIQVEGRITGTEQERQVVFCGAAPRDLADLSLREIALLQTLEPPKDWSLAPGDRTEFLIVFTGPPAELREYSAEVVAVRAPTWRPAPAGAGSSG